MNTFRSKRSPILSSVEYLFRLAGLAIVFDVVVVTFQLGSGYVYHVIDYGLGWYLPRQVSDDSKSSLLWNLKSSSVFSFLLLDNFHLRKFFCVSFKYYNFGLLTKLEYVLLFFVLRAKLQALDPKSKNECINASNMRIILPLVIIFCCFKHNYCTHLFPLTQEVHTNLMQINSKIVLCM